MARKALRSSPNLTDRPRNGTFSTISPGSRRSRKSAYPSPTSPVSRRLSHHAALTPRVSTLTCQAGPPTFILAIILRIRSGLAGPGISSFTASLTRPGTSRETRPGRSGRLFPPDGHSSVVRLQMGEESPVPSQVPDRVIHRPRLVGGRVATVQPGSRSPSSVGLLGGLATNGEAILLKATFLGRF